MPDIPNSREAARLIWLRLPYVIVITALAYLVCVMLMEGRDLFRLSNCMMLAVAIAVVISYSKGLLRPSFSYESRLLVTGILCTWLAAIYNRGLVVYQMEILHRPMPVRFDDGWDLLASTLAFYLATIGGLLHLVAPGSIQGAIPDRNWLRVGRAMGFGVALFGLVIVISLEEVQRIIVNEGDFLGWIGLGVVAMLILLLAKEVRSVVRARRRARENAQTCEPFVSYTTADDF